MTVGPKIVIYLNDQHHYEYGSASFNLWEIDQYTHKVLRLCWRLASICEQQLLLHNITCRTVSDQQVPKCPHSSEACCPNIMASCMPDVMTGITRA